MGLTSQEFELSEGNVIISKHSCDNFKCSILMECGYLKI